jgi:uncharacterized protein YegL
MKRPGGPLAARALHFFWIADCSGSMSADGKIQSLNNAAREALPNMRRVAEENRTPPCLCACWPSPVARWLVAEPTPVASFSWVDLEAGGVTDLGAALSMVTKELHVPPMTSRALPPALVLVSDGQPTDNFEQGLAELLAEPWGQRAVRIAIAIGRDTDYEVLERIIGNPMINPLTANHPDELVRYINWASTAVLQSASSPRIDPAATGPPVGVAIPTPPSAPPADVAPTW